MDRYANSENEMVCQCCEKEMPFRLEDGLPFFVAAVFDSSCPRELQQNRIALCPVCAAKFQHARKTMDNELVECLSTKPDLHVPVQLAGKEETIRFNRMHRDDLLTGLGAARK